VCKPVHLFEKVTIHIHVNYRLSRKCIKKARLLDTLVLYILKLSAIVYNVDVGNNGIGMDRLMGIYEIIERGTAVERNNNVLMFRLLH
jgi:hypothetical protein